MADKIFYAVLLGSVLGIIYDFLRLIRYIFKDKLFCDLFFWCLSAVLVYCYLLIFNDGIIRVLLVFIILTGFLIYFFTVGKLTRKMELSISRALRNAVKNLIKSLKKSKKLLQSKHNIYYNIIRKPMANVKRFFKGGLYEKKSKEKQKIN